MLKKLWVLMFCSFILLFLATSTVNADAKKGWYIGVGLGGAFVPDSDWKNTSDGTSGELQYDTGFILNASVGYKFGMPRLEAEVSYLSSDYDKLVENDGTTRTVDGDINATTFLINGYLDFENKSGITPFIFAGIGICNLESYLSIPFGAKLFDDDDTVFAYQAGAGLSMQMAPSVALDLKYSYFGTADADFKDLTSNTNVENEFGSHNFIIGIRYSF